MLFRSFPNLDLKPEKSISSDLSIGISNENLNLSATGFYTLLKDAIIRKSFNTPSGESLYDNFGESLNVVANQNSQTAIIYGYSLQGNINLNTQLELSSSINYTKGIEKIDGAENLPFSHIPPLYGQSAVKFQNAVWTFKLLLNYNDSKGIELFGGSVDNPELATPIGALGWSTLNFYGQYNFSENLTFSLALENIFDKHYRPFASGVSAPGRNLILSVKAKI